MLVDVETSQRPMQADFNFSEDYSGLLFFAMDLTIANMESTSTPSTQTVESLGKVTYATKPDMTNLLAGVILASLLMGGGIAFAASSIRELLVVGGNHPESDSPWIGVVAGIVIFAGGVALLLWVVSLFRLRIYICENGFYITRRGEATVYAWSEITAVREVILHERPPLVKAPARQLLPTMTSRSYTVVRCDGNTFKFGKNLIPRTSLLAGPLSSAAKDFGFTWETTEQTAS